MKNKRCPWALRSELEMKYHDEEWGVPTRDDGYIFEMLILEGMQAGLSWSTIIKKRLTMREAFDNFIPEIIAEYTEDKIKYLMNHQGVIRHELKIRSVIHNANIYLNLLDKGESLSAILWSFVDDQVIVNANESIDDVQTQSEESRALSKELKRLGFKFVGPTTVYALMQAIGMVNDHLVTCPFYKKK